MLRLKFKYILFTAFFASLSMNNEILGYSLFRRPQSLEAVHAQSTAMTIDDQAIIKRVVESYRRSANTVENRSNSMWQSFFDKKHVKLHYIFMNEKL